MPLGSLLGSAWEPLWPIDMFNIQVVALYEVFERSAYFSSGSTEIQHPGASWRLSGLPWSVLEVSWHPLAVYDQALGGHESERNIIFHWFCACVCGTPTEGRPPATERAGAVERGRGEA